MEFKELKQKPTGELKKILSENLEKLRDLRFKVAAKQLKNIREIRVVKKLNARILTLLNKPKTETSK